MSFEIQHPGRRLAVALFVISASTIYVISAGLQVLATQFSKTSGGSGLNLAVKLDPFNAEYYEKLARLELLDRQSPAAALRWSETATALNPNRATYWLERGAAEKLTGNLAAAIQSVTRAKAVEPHSAAVSWEIANLDLEQGDTQDALREYRKVMENEPPLRPQAIQICWKIQPDIDSLLENVIPANVNTEFLSFLVSSDQPEAAAKVWERIVSLSQPVSRPFLFEYLRYLFAHRDVAQAKRVWQEAAIVSDLAAYQPTDENLIINGDFSLDMLNGGFDWMYQKASAVTLALDPIETHGSSRSLRIFFEGPGIVDAGIRQIVSVEPNAQYAFSGFYKAEEMDGAGGPRFAIQDLYSEATLFMSDDLHNSDFWSPVNGTFTTGLDTHAIVLRIARVPQGSPIRGKLWIDDLKLVTADHVASIQKGRP